MSKYNCIGVSSSNVYMPGLTQPISLIYIPKPDYSEHIALLNPRIIYLSNFFFPSYEGCGSIPDKRCLVPTATCCFIEGLTLSGEYISLSYG